MAPASKAPHCRRFETSSRFFLSKKNSFADFGEPAPRPSSR